MTSIRRTLAIRMALAVFGVTAVICVLTFFLVRQMLVEDFNRAATDQFQAVANSVKVWTDGDVYVELNPAVLTGFASGGDRGFVVRDATTGAVIEQSVSFASAGANLPQLLGVNAENITLGRGTAPNGVPAVVLAKITMAQWGWDLDDTAIETVPGARETRVEITVAIDRTPLTLRIRSLAFLVLMIAAGAALAATLAALVAAKSVLRPLGNLADRAARITEPTYARPFPSDGPAELQPIAERLNDLLNRLADASLSERRFTADAAHELRTPIAELRTLTDVALRFPTAPEQLKNVVQSSNDLSIRLTSLVDALLSIARRDTAVNNLQEEWVDPPQMIARIVQGLSDQAQARNLVLNVAGPTHHRVLTDSTLFQSILTNLIGNAVSYAPDDDQINITYQGSKNGFQLHISNRAPDLNEADVAKLFVPFWRKEGRGVQEPHSGLGLALCKSFAEILKLELSAQLSPDGTLSVQLTGSAKN